jgi:hypothetical protein
MNGETNMDDIQLATAETKPDPLNPSRSDAKRSERPTRTRHFTLAQSVQAHLSGPSSTSRQQSGPAPESQSASSARRRTLMERLGVHHSESIQADAPGTKTPEKSEAPGLNEAPAPLQETSRPPRDLSKRLAALKRENVGLSTYLTGAADT